MTRNPPIIDMNSDGSFRAPPQRPTVPFSFKVLAGAIVVAAISISIAVAAAAVWVISILLPVIVIAAGVAWVAAKYRRWQLTRRQGTVARHHPGGFTP